MGQFHVVQVINLKIRVWFLEKKLPYKEDIVVVVWLGEALLYTLKIKLQPEVEEKFLKFRVKKNIRWLLFIA